MVQLGVIVDRLYCTKVMVKIYPQAELANLVVHSLANTVSCNCKCDYRGGQSFVVTNLQFSAVLINECNLKSLNLEVNYISLAPILHILTPLFKQHFFFFILETLIA